MGALEQVVERAVLERGAVLMGILNVTPDSFSDGGRYLAPEAACARVDELLAEGAEILDIGSESTRPGALLVSPEEQIRRAAGVIEYALDRGAIVSIDTASPEVAEAALSRGAHVLNDVSCLGDCDLASVVAKYDATLLLMHSRGAMTADRMASFSDYPEDGYVDVVKDVEREWLRSANVATSLGVRPERLWFDPGLGFHKNGEQSAEILGRLEEFRSLGTRVVIGASRKSLIGRLDGSGPEARLGGSIAAGLRAVDAGATVLRVHDVHATRQALLARRAFASRKEARCSTL